MTEAAPIATDVDSRSSTAGIAAPGEAAVLPVDAAVAAPADTVAAPADTADEAAEAAPGEETASTAPRPRRWVTWRGDLLALAVYVLGAFWVTQHGWAHPHSGSLNSNGDVAFNEWMLANAAHAVTHLSNPFFTTLQNAPLGVNLMANVGLQLPGILLTPITLLFGPAFAYLALITLNLFGTGYAWYFVLSRRVVASRAAAFVGGLFCAFAPAMISHSSGHPHITAQWLVPFIVWQLLSLADGRRTVLRGVTLGLLLTAQLLLGEEILLMTALGAGIGLATYVALRPRAAAQALRPFFTGLAVAAVVAGVLCAYPLWMQFLGPQHRYGAPGNPDVYALKFGSFVAYSEQAISGSKATVHALAGNRAEQSAFFGWPLIVMAAAIVVWLRREVMVRALAVVGVAAAIISTGTTLSWGARRFDVPAPFALLRDVPIFDDIVVGRFALITTATLGVLLAIGADRFLARDREVRLSQLDRPAKDHGRARHVAAGGPSMRVIGAGALIAVLLPLTPMPLPVWNRIKVPNFITSGEWHAYVAPGHTLVPVPVDDVTSIRWGAAADVGFAVPQGYFLGPTSSTDATGRWFAPPQPTETLLKAVAKGKALATVTNTQRAQAAADAAYWKADALVLPKKGQKPAVLTVMTNLYGAPQSVDDVWVWEIRR